MMGVADPQPIAGSGVVVTGASGFIGAQLVQRLVALGADVVATVRPESDLSRIEHLLDHVEVMRVDVTALEAHHVARLAGRIGTVFHLAAAGVVAHGTDPRRIVSTATTGTLRVLEAAHCVGARRVVYCGSCFEYGAGNRVREDAAPAPMTEYGAAKAAGWLLAQAFWRRHGLPVVGVRPFTVYGPLEAPARLVPYVIRAAMRDQPIELTDGGQMRDFVYVEDVVDGLIAAALAAGVEGEAFNLCTGSPLSVADVVWRILELIGGDARPVLGARVRRATDTPLLCGDPAKAARDLGWRGRTSLSDGLTATIDWQRRELDRDSRAGLARSLA